MTPSLALSLIDLALTLFPARLTSDQARRMLLAIGLQESRLQHRRQIRGPARGYPQFEVGGVRGVLTHNATRQMARDLLETLDYSGDTDAGSIQAALEHNDVLTWGFARLNLWWMPAPLPTEEHAGWQYYLDSWRPGRPHPETWPTHWRRASELVYGGDL